MLNNTDYIPLTIAKDIAVPAHLARIGLSSVEKMTELQEAQRLFKPQVAEWDDEELFVKPPKFKVEIQKKRRSTSKKQHEQADDQLANGHAVTELNRRRLRNFLKQSMAHRWVSFEFLESQIDYPLLSARFSMEHFLSECCPMLGTRFMQRRGWQQIRRHIGKPRRFSPTFIIQERVELDRQRCIFRFLQRCKVEGKVMPQDLVDQMPGEVPLPLTANTRVSTYLTDPYEGLRIGIVLSFDIDNNSYGVNFKIEGKPTVLNIPDMCLYVEKENKNMSLLQMRLSKGSYNSLLLTSVLQLEQLLSLKHESIQQIININTEFKGKETSMRRQFKLLSQRDKLHRRYVNTMLTLHRVNEEILEPLNIVHSFVHDYECDENEGKQLESSDLYHKCCMLAELDFKKSNAANRLQSGEIQELILNLQTLMYMFSELGQKNSASAVYMMDDYMSDMLIRMPVQLAAQFKNMVKSVLHPLREEILRMTRPTQEQMQSQVPPHLEEQLQSEMQAQMQSEMQLEMGSEIQLEMQAQMESQLQAQIQLQIDSQMSEIRAQLESEMESKRQAQFQSQKESKFQSKLQAQLEMQSQLQMKSHIESSTSFADMQTIIDMKPEYQFDSSLDTDMQLVPELQFHTDFHLDTDLQFESVLPLERDFHLEPEVKFEPDLELQPDLMVFHDL